MLVTKMGAGWRVQSTQEVRVQPCEACAMVREQAYLRQQSTAAARRAASTARGVAPAGLTAVIFAETTKSSAPEPGIHSLMYSADEASWRTSILSKPASRSIRENCVRRARARR